jgi:hypothetical protein
MTEFSQLPCVAYEETGSSDIREQRLVFKEVWYY